jgi:lipoate-protein ligase A
MLSLRIQLEPDLWGGLAREDCWLDHEEAPILFLWRGEKGLVLGKNQNPWQEANLSVLRERGLCLARRVSGGGSVVHDPGNLNISWLLPRAHYQPEILHAVLRSALEKLGLPAKTTPTGATLLQGRKVSGSAYCHRRERVLHHSTLLWQADLDTLRAALSVPRVRLHTHAVSSLPVQVANLCDFLPGLTLPELLGALRSAATDAFGEALTQSGAEIPLDPSYLHKMRDPAWIWGQTPRFRAEIRIENQTLLLDVAKGRIEQISWGDQPLTALISAPLDADFPQILAQQLNQHPTDIAEILAAQGWDFRLQD